MSGPDADAALRAVLLGARAVDQRVVQLRQRTVRDDRGGRVFEGNDEYVARVAASPGIAADLRALAHAIDELVGTSRDGQHRVGETPGYRSAHRDDNSNCCVSMYGGYGCTLDTGHPGQHEAGADCLDTDPPRGVIAAVWS